MNRMTPSILFVWIPFGVQSGVRTEDMAWLYPVLVLLVALFVLQIILTRHH